MIRFFKSRPKNQKGIALLLALFCVMIISFLAVEISFDTTVEYVLSSKEYSREKAYAAARAGVELSLLRIQLFRNITGKFGKQLEGQQAITQMIWSFPFAWPPAMPTNASIVEKDQITEAMGNSLMEAKYAATISSEGSKIDINDLDSPSEALKKATREEILQIFENRRTNDDAWAEKHRSFNPEELVNNITDWISDGNTSLNGGDKKSKYPDFNKNGEDSVPPNRPFQTLDELKMVAGMTEELFQMLLPQITVYGIKGINVNQANAETLRAIDPLLNNEDVLNKVLERRSDPDKGGPFKDQNDLIGFIGANEKNFNPSKIPLYFGNEYNFRIHSTGEYGNVTREIIAIVYDVGAVQTQLKAVIDQEQKDKQGQNNQNNQQNNQNQNNQNQNGQNQQNQNNQNQQQQQTTPPAGKPRVVYWWEN